MQQGVYVLESVLITGGTGSIGTEIINHIEAKRIVVYSRDEYKQMVLKDQCPKVECVLGDIRDADALYNALYGIDLVIHCAALKQLPRGETDPLEFKKTNVDGAIALIDACIAQGVRKCIVISTDKAVEPISAYGLSKALADRLFIDANKYNITSFVICRFGNVMGSRGSVIWKFKKWADEGKPLIVTQREATRFWLDVPTLLKTVDEAIKNGKSNEIFVPRMPSFVVFDFAATFDKPIEITQLRKNEKLDEVAISEYEQYCQRGNWYVIHNKDLPGIKTKAYMSDTNDWWLLDTEMRRKIGKLCSKDDGCGAIKAI